MATTFQSMNVAIGPRDAAEAPSDPVALGSPIRTPREDGNAASSGARVSFAEPSNKRALPVSPQGSTFPPLAGSHDDRASTGSGGSPKKANRREDVEMGSDNDEDGSDTESADGEDGRPSKKKKGQRFFCTDYPPCNLSFTRSEHLARHIRKHTGERPFQCHCARRFSRLDNLRQHAQTVHVNEDIPGDSLAATGTRFQRQIRTDRVRPQGRARASTAGSTSSHRGHGRNLSTSSIASTSSTMSTLSNISGLGHDPIRRPPPLLMADASQRGRLTIDTMKASPHSGYPAYGRQSPGADPTTPTSYSNTPSSPFNSTLGSPLNVARQGSWSGSGHNRRLSVPSGANPFQPASVPSPGYAAGPIHPGRHSRTSSTNSIVASPTTSVHSFATSEASEADWRRRTWHPSTYGSYYQQRPATSGLAFHQTPDGPRPAFAHQQQAASPAQQRLPGIETFDHLSQRPTTPTNAQQQQPPPNPEPTRQPTYPGADRRGHASWDMSLHQNLTRLDIANGTPPREASWRTHDASAHLASPQGQGPPRQLAREATYPPLTSQASQETIRSPVQAHTFDSATSHEPPATTPRSAKRQGFYHAPPFSGPHPYRPAPRTTSEDTSSSEGVPTPLTAAVDYKPSIVHANGYIEPQSAAGPSYSTYHPHGAPAAAHPHHEYPRHPPSSAPAPGTEGKSHAMTGLEALVAAAASEEKARGGQ